MYNFNNENSIRTQLSSRVLLQEDVAIQFIRSSYRDLIAVSKLFYKLDPVVKPRDDNKSGLPRRADALLAMTLNIYVFLNKGISRYHIVLPLALILALTISPVMANQPDRFEELTHQIKCPVCDGQSIADSQALLAQDLRNYIKKEIALGKSDAEIKSFLQSRYGDAILLDTPFKPETALLWGVPLLFGLGLLTVFGLRFRKRP